MNRKYVPSLHLDCVNLIGEVQKKILRIYKQNKLTESPSKPCSSISLD